MKNFRVTAEMELMFPLHRKGRLGLRNRQQPTIFIYFLQDMNIVGCFLEFYKSFGAWEYQGRNKRSN